MKITKATAAACSEPILSLVPQTGRRSISSLLFFGRSNFLEAAFARFKVVDGVGCSIVYSHRIYGEKVGDQMSKWLNDSGPKMEKMLMDWTNSPSPASFRNLPCKQVCTDDAETFAAK